MQQHGEFTQIDECFVGQSDDNANLCCPFEWMPDVMLTVSAGEWNAHQFSFTCTPPVALHGFTVSGSVVAVTWQLHPSTIFTIEKALICATML